MNIFLRLFYVSEASNGGHSDLGHTRLCFCLSCLLANPSEVNQMRAKVSTTKRKVKSKQTTTTKHPKERNDERENRKEQLPL